MGCASSTSGDNREPAAVSDFRRVSWSSATPMTLAMVLVQRAEFWATAPAYGGSALVWDALKAASESDDPSLVAAILDSAGIVCPAGNLLESYDETGVRYDLPLFCLSLPANLRAASPEPRSDTQTVPLSRCMLTPDNLELPASSAPCVPVTVRLSTGPTLQLDAVFPLETTAAQIVAAVARCTRVPPEHQALVFRGRRLTRKVTLADVAYLPGDVLQVFVLAPPPPPLRIPSPSPS